MPGGNIDRMNIVCQHSLIVFLSYELRGDGRNIGGQQQNSFSAVGRGILQKK
jgi:hypothetical protein